MGYCLRNKARDVDDWSLELTEREPVSYLEVTTCIIYFSTDCQCWVMMLRNSVVIESGCSEYVDKPQ